ncbi:MAG: hydrogenase maturation protease [Clostridiaceae bacterium]|nr:hydrogenase maturation protease [Clostridiaceae bacterium]
MKSILVIGIGSRIMMDDAIGTLVVEDLQKHNNPNVKYLSGETDVDYCIGEISDYEYVVVIDAFISGKQPGEITIVPFSRLNAEKEDCLYSMHGMHCLNMIKHAGKVPNGTLIGIEPYDINFGSSLSNTLKSCYPCILRDVQNHLVNILKELEEGKMHDTFLLKRISDALGALCSTNRFSKITKLQVTTCKNSHIEHDNLFEQLLKDHNESVGEWTEIIIIRRDIEDNTAVIDSVEGETFE